MTAFSGFPAEGLNFLAGMEANSLPKSSRPISSSAVWPSGR